MTATTIDAPDLAAGVRAADAWRFVEVSAPALVKALDEAREAYDRHERALQERTAAYQRAHCTPRRRVPSPFAKALAVAESAVEARLEALIVEGVVVFGGYPAGQLDGDPVVIPTALLAGRRPRGSRCTVRGVTFHELRLFRAEALPVAEPEPEVETPPATLAGLVQTLVDLFSEDAAWAKAGTERLAEMVAARDPRFKPHQGPAKAGCWSAATLRQRIKECRAEAKALAAT